MENPKLRKRVKNWVSPSDLKQPDRARLEQCLYKILDSAIEADYALLGNIQLLNTKSAALQIVAQRGFDLTFMNHFEFVRGYDGSACARAFAEKQRVMIPDITDDASFASHRSVAQASGFRAVQSTPVFSRGVVRGVLSTHFPAVHRLSDTASAKLDACATQIGMLIAEFDPA